MINEENAKNYCYQDLSLIENYDKAISDKEHMWDCHHRIGTIMNCSKKNLMAVGAYYDRPSHDLIFLRHDEHLSLHKHGNRNWVGRKHSEETRKKMSVVQKGNKGALGNKNWLGKKHSEETKMKMSLAHKGYKWYNNGFVSVLAKECPSGFVRGRKIK